LNLLSAGDLIWMECLPGGVTVYLGQEVETPGDEVLLYEIYHPELGRQKMPEYYFISLNEAGEIGYTTMRRRNRRLLDD